MSVFKANSYVNKITNISPYYFLENNIEAVLVDLDNTVIDPKNDEIEEDVYTWLATMKENNIAICFVSNRFNQEKEAELTNKLQTKVIMRAYKPLAKGLKEALEHLEISSEVVCLIGDQTFTDVIGGNLVGLHTIKVNPLNQCLEDGLLSNACRKLEGIYFSMQKETSMFNETTEEIKSKILSKKPKEKTNL